MTIPLATGLRRPSEDCLLTAEEEDPLRAFCGLVARRTPRAGELAWALRRFELGCERSGAVEALTDWLLAARALFADEARATRTSPSGSRRSAPRRRGPRAAREPHQEAISLERAAMCGFVRPRTRSTRWWKSSAAACGRSCATCSAGTSIRPCAWSRTRYVRWASPRSGLRGSVGGVRTVTVAQREPRSEPPVVVGFPPPSTCQLNRSFVIVSLAEPIDLGPPPGGQAWRSQLRIG